MKQEYKKRGAKPKLTLDEKISIATSYCVTGGDMSQRGIFTRLMHYANENGYSVNNINTFSEDPAFRQQLSSLILVRDEDIDPSHTVVGYEDIDVQYYLNLSKADLRQNLILLRDKIRTINKASFVAIEKYSAISKLADQYREEASTQKEELALTKVKFKKLESEIRKLNAQLQEYRDYISEHMYAAMKEEQMDNLKGISKEKLSEIAMTSVSLSKERKSDKFDSLDAFFNNL